jgi:hypothetical protein
MVAPARRDFHCWRGEKRNTIKKVERTQTTDFLPFAGHFSPGGAKNDLQKKKSTMLPQAMMFLTTQPRTEKTNS